MLEKLVFSSLAGLTLLCALAVVTVRNTVHSALFLGLSLAGVAGLFATLGADFLFAGQILIYVTGVAVLVMFVVMLLGRASDLHLRQVNVQWPAALLICAISMFGFWRALSQFAGRQASAPTAPTAHGLANLLLTEYAVPFELISLVLLAALIGAVFFSQVEKKP